ncbi:MAG: zinc ribbon domain-containing protein [Treponema sp.]|uniref:zinc ribbon domain-containing protein n=1 Tax=Treponema sp. TaxID=166 RepID=UPI00298DB286|nr:zinc ribbon domain-containing protein [Treponema sp.]MCQ2600115.1 zinc ribbon domain-containing protein [Treponema sp.]
MAKKQAKFFCENCGEEVAQNARFCNKCGRFFSAVRCPQCGKVGSSHAFVNGCPSCGYAEKGSKSKSTKQNKDPQFEAKNNKSHFYMHKPKYASPSSSTNKKSAGSSLPVWIYILTLGVLAVMIVILMKCSY